MIDSPPSDVNLTGTALAVGLPAATTVDIAATTADLAATTVTALVFALVYVGMIFGRLPGLRLDRTGVALVGALTLIATGSVSLETAWQSIDVPTMALLFALMVVCSHLQLSGFFGVLTTTLTRVTLGPTALLAMIIGTTGVLSAILTNDVVCLAVAPVLVDLCRRRQLNPAPFLLAVACASNVGSAATLIGNPQNILIGQRLAMAFNDYLATAAAPVIAGLGLTWAIITWQYRGRWQQESPTLPPTPTLPVAAASPASAPIMWPMLKGLLVMAALMAAFTLTSLDRATLALAGAAVIMTSRHLSASRHLQSVDWSLLMLFIGLFVVNHAIEQTGLPALGVDALARWGLPLRDPTVLFCGIAVLSNVVSNVPAVMLLLPTAEGMLATGQPQAGAILALSSTLAGNLLIVGSIANIIVVESARRDGVTIDWRCHAKVGIPVTLSTLTTAAGWLWLRA